jgi:hypothetical protein
MKSSPLAGQQQAITEREVERGEVNLWVRRVGRDDRVGRKSKHCVTQDDIAEVYLSLFRVC